MAGYEITVLFDADDDDAAMDAKKMIWNTLPFIVDNVEVCLTDLSNLEELR